MVYFAIVILLAISYLSTIGKANMAKCDNCGKTTTIGRSRSFSMRATSRTYKPNLQKITIFENGIKVKKTLCAKCIRTLVKEK